ncbi:MAG: monofunctional biosynthetic peptidoglycan transglycosylase [Ignavibacteriales bacterium]|nr:MAG: monofunctional biosynthetic peptidoglycan transglycosylase [Ignavibacteriales bacterium]
MYPVEFELTHYFKIFLRYFKEHRLKTIIFYFLIVGYLSIPSFQIPVLEYNSFRITSLMEQRAIENYMLFYPSQSWTSIGSVNPALLKSIISIEDGKFFIHKGIDWKELETSMKVNQRRKRTARGASTITMQLAKNLYLTTNKSILRKAKEFIITFRMEKELPKKVILENYINAVEWGDGIFGIKRAASEYFDKDPDKLTVIECSRLAAVIPSPLRHKPNTNSGYVLRRASLIRGRMNDVQLNF